MVKDVGLDMGPSSVDSAVRKTYQIYKPPAALHSFNHCYRVNDNTANIFDMGPPSVDSTVKKNYLIYKKQRCETSPSTSVMCGVSDRKWQT